MSNNLETRRIYDTPVVMSNNLETRRMYYDAPVVVRSGQKSGRVCSRDAFQTIGIR